MRDLHVLSTGLWIIWEFELSIFGLNGTRLQSGFTNLVPIHNQFVDEVHSLHLLELKWRFWMQKETPRCVWPQNECSWKEIKKVWAPHKGRDQRFFGGSARWKVIFQPAKCEMTMKRDSPAFSRAFRASWPNSVKPETKMKLKCCILTLLFSSRNCFRLKICCDFFWHEVPKARHFCGSIVQLREKEKSRLLCSIPASIKFIPCFVWNKGGPACARYQEAQNKKRDVPVHAALISIVVLTTYQKQKALNWKCLQNMILRWIRRIDVNAGFHGVSVSNSAIRFRAMAEEGIGNWSKCHHQHLCQFLLTDKKEKGRTWGRQKRKKKFFHFFQFSWKIIGLPEGHVRSAITAQLNSCAQPTGADRTSTRIRLYLHGSKYQVGLSRQITPLTPL